MRKVLLAFAVIGLVAGGASAQDDLTGGVFMCHHPPGIVFTSDTPVGGWCPLNDLDGCNENNDEIEMTETVWFVCAPLENPSVWCGTEFGVTYTPYGWIPIEYDVCAPGGFLTIPTAGWPGPNEGISIATTDVSWTGNFEEVYWFGGYGYYGGVWCLMDNPGSPGTVGFSNCSQVEFPAECFGCIGFGPGNFGYDCCPAPPPPPGACCYPDGYCLVQEPLLCQGVCLGDDVPCSPNPCPQPGACCVGDVCHYVLLDECTGLGGVFQGIGIPCQPNPCVEYGACCYPDGTTCIPNLCPGPGACCIGHTCYFVLEDECATMMGVWMGVGIPFESGAQPSNPCDIFTPADPSSWGTIKAIYR